METKVDQQMMRRAIELAMRGRGLVEPNPMVGCVIVREGRSIGEGFHLRYGGPHAEPMALSSCPESAAGATAYVTLEPCCHVEKKTPPCVPRLIEAKITRVVLGCLDPNPLVNGRGVAQLREAGLEVTAGVLEEECRQLIAPYIAVTQHSRPYITLKWAQDAGGKVALAGGKRVQISNERSQQVVHALRARCDAIAVGVNTVLSDDPLLTARDVPPARPIRRYVLDRHLRTPTESQLVRTARQTPLIIATGEPNARSERAAELNRQGVEVIVAPMLAALVKDWGGRSLSHVLIEPGPTLAAAMIQQGLADRVWIIRSPETVGDGTGPAAVELPGEFVSVGRANLDGDQLTEYLNSRSPVFYAAVASADFRSILPSD
jgi:diaminohydroxyphosphoribosylaminopyrimidine deaminase/5-amino-6-(5-phosphoribosylamino)uracil reductase